MFFDREESYLAQVEKNLKEQQLRKEKLDLDIMTLFKKAEINPKELSAYMKDPSNFSEQEWKELQTIREKLEKELHIKDDTTTDLRQTKKAYQNLPRDPHWIPVR